MKTLKYQGEEYQVIDLWMYESEYTSNLIIIAGKKKDNLNVIVEFEVTFFKELNKLDLRYTREVYTNRTLDIIQKFAKAN